MHFNSTKAQKAQAEPVSVRERTSEWMDGWSHWQIKDTPKIRYLLLAVCVPLTHRAQPNNVNVKKASEEERGIVYT